jgi:hypothetical protein
MYAELKTKGVGIDIRDGINNCTYNIAKIREEKKAKGGGRTSDEYLVIQHRSACTRSYFKGITMEVMENVLQNLRGLGEVEFEDDMLPKILNNIEMRQGDITRNAIFKTPDEILIESMTKVADNSINRDKIKVFNYPSNKGINFGLRDSHPKTVWGLGHMTIYHKSLQAKMDEIGGILTDQERYAIQFLNIWRTEINLWNKKVIMAQLNIKDTKLVSILEAISNTQAMNDLFKRRLNDWLVHDRVRVERNYGELSPTEKQILGWIIAYVDVVRRNENRDVDVVELFAIFDSINSYTGETEKEKNTIKQAKRRLKKQFNKIMDVYYSDKSKTNEQIKRQIQLTNDLMELLQV